MGCRRTSKRRHDTIQKGLTFFALCLWAANLRRGDPDSLDDSAAVVSFERSYHI